MTKLTDNQKKAAVTGGAAVAGVAAGVAAASFMTTDAGAKTTDDTQDDAEVLAAQPQAGAAVEEQAHTAEHTTIHETVIIDDTHLGGAAGLHHGEPVSHDDIHPIPDPDPAPTPEPDPEDADVSVVGYQTVSDENGNQVDVAALDINGDRIVVADTTMDGYANVAVADVNGNGQIDDDEIVDVSDQHIAMQPFRDAANQSDVNYAGDGGSDDAHDSQQGDIVDVDNSQSASEPDTTPTETLYTDAGADADYTNDANVDDYMA